MPVIVCVTGHSAVRDDQHGLGKFTGFVEHYFINQSDAGRDKVGQRARWINLELDFPGPGRVVAGEFSINQMTFLDETFLEIGEGPFVKIGKIRPAIGFYDWNEWYTGFVSAPLVRRARFSNFTMLQSMAAGVEVSGGTPELSYKAAALDGSLRNYQLMADRIDRAAVRLQTYCSGVILGLNGIWSFDDLQANPTRIGGLDFWWTTPQLQVRGQFFKDFTAKAKGEGWNLDTFLKPFGWANTTLVARAQAVRGFSSSPKPTELYTVGAKHDLSAQLSLDLNYSFGPVGPANKTELGWKFQLMTKIRF